MNQDQVTQLNRSIDRGVVLLDAIDPLWFHRIDPETLSMSSCQDCCLGQMFGEYWDAAVFLWGDAAEFCPNRSDLISTSSKYGFALPFEMDSGTTDDRASAWGLLADLWRTRIYDRRTEFAALCENAQANMTHLVAVI